jgi:hypothetical protein
MAHMEAPSPQSSAKVTPSPPSLSSLNNLLPPSGITSQQQQQQQAYQQYSPPSPSPSPMMNFAPAVNSQAYYPAPQQTNNTPNYSQQQMPPQMQVQQGYSTSSMPGASRAPPMNNADPRVKDAIEICNFAIAALKVIILIAISCFAIFCSNCC